MVRNPSGGIGTEVEVYLNIGEGHFELSFLYLGFENLRSIQIKNLAIKTYSRKYKSLNPYEAYELCRKIKLPNFCYHFEILCSLV